jgi:uroporphyrinogen-III synthase
MTHRPTVLVTRPEGQGTDLCQRLHEAGFDTCQQPLLRLQPLRGPSARQRSQLLALDEFSHVIFVSANAVRFGMAWIEDFWPQLPVGIHWYTVGEATAQALAGHGIAALTPGADMSSEGLLALPQLQSVKAQKVLIVKGQGGRRLLMAALESRGAVVAELSCYKRIAPKLPPGTLAQQLQEHQIEAVAISSGEGLLNFLALLSPQETINLTGMTLVVPSQRVARQAGEAGFAHVVLADNASDDAVLQALVNWHQTAGDSE